MAFKKKKQVPWDFFLFLGMISLNTVLLPLKPPLLLPEDNQPGHAAHQQRRERSNRETYSYHVITAQEKINWEKDPFPTFYSSFNSHSGQ